MSEASTVSKQADIDACGQGSLRGSRSALLKGKSMHLVAMDAEASRACQPLVTDCALHSMVAHHIQHPLRHTCCCEKSAFDVLAWCKMPSTSM